MQTSDEAREQFGKRLAALRIRADLKQQELADALTRRGYPYSDNAVSAWERGVALPPLPDAGFAHALASVLLTTTSGMFAHLGLIDQQADAITPDEMRLLRAYRTGDKQALLEILVKMGRDE